MTLFHALSKWLPVLVSPLGLALAALLLALLLQRRRRLSTGLTATALLLLWVFGMPMTSRALILGLESRYPPVVIDELPPANLAILLGGGVSLADAVRGRAELGPGGDRVALVAELWHADLVDRILVSAGTLAPRPGVPSEAETTARILEGWGVPRRVIAVEGRSGTTYENARFSAAMLAGEATPRRQGEDASRRTTAAGTGRAYLVTSALHLPRARALFCAAGIDTIGLAANRWIGERRAWFELAWIPDATSLRGSSEALREYLGIAVYAALGRLDTGALAHDQRCAAHQA